MDGPAITKKEYLNIAWKGIVVGIIYLAVYLLPGVLAFMTGNASSPVGYGPIPLAALFVCCCITGMVFGFIDTRINASKLWHFAIWFCILFFSLLAVTIEGYFFSPGLMTGVAVVAAVIMNAITSCVVAALVVLLFSHKAVKTEENGVKRPWYSWL